MRGWGIAVSTCTAGALVWACVGDDPAAKAGGSDAGGVDATNGADSAGVGDAGADQSATSDADTDASDGGATYELLDDFEANSGQLPATNGRSAHWYGFNDSSDGGVQTPTGGLLLPQLLSPARGASTYAMHSQGSGFTVWGGSIAFDFVESSGAPQYYDLSAYSGVFVWARATTSGTVRIQLSDRNTEAAGGICTVCADHFGKDVTLTTAWTRYAIKFSDLAQGGWGTPATLDKTHVHTMLFASAANTSWDYWIDDLYLIK